MKKTNSVTKTARAEFLAQNPKAAALQKKTIAEFLRYANGYFDDVSEVTKKFITGAENARVAGTYLTEYVESLPGKKLTPDFYEQEKSMFVKRDGMRISLDQLNWFMGVAERRKEKFELISDVFPIGKDMLLQSGELPLIDRGPQSPHIPPEPTVALKAYFDSSLAETINALRSNEKYCPGGHLRPDLKPLLFEDLKPKLAAWDDSREWLRQELGC
jgi:hypothetical protein